MLTIRAVTQYKKDLKRFQYDKVVLRELNSVLKTLIAEELLDIKYKDHNLTGQWRLSRECHIKPDVLLIYRIDQKTRELILERLGSHSELFE